MTKHKIIVTGVRVALAALIVAAPTVADAKFSFKHAFHSVTHSVEGAANTVGSGVEGAANTVANGVQNAAGATAKLSKKEMASVRTQANQAFAATAGAMQQGYNAAVAEVKKLVDGVLEQLCRAAAKAFMNDSQKYITQLRNNMVALDQEGQDALHRVIRAIPSKQITQQTYNDMRLIGSKLGLIPGQPNSLSFVNPPSPSPYRKAAEYVLGLVSGQAYSAVPSSVSKSTFGIVIGVSGGDGTGSLSGEVGLVMQTYAENGHVRLGFVNSYGAGVGVMEPGMGTEVAISWSPGGIDNVPGPAVGLGGSVPFAPDVGIALSWSVPTSLAGFKSLQPVPGFTMSLAIPNFWAAEAGPEAVASRPPQNEIAFQGGYSLLAGSVSF